LSVKSPSKLLFQSTPLRRMTSCTRPPPVSSEISVARAKNRSSATSPTATGRALSARSSIAAIGLVSLSVAMRHARVNPGPAASTTESFACARAAGSTFSEKTASGSPAIKG
jgi:hypothetical protein